jgi:hypothetical protein
MSNQTAKAIYEFKKGDIITRLKPFNDESGFKDYTLVGNPVVFLGIANACVYLSKKSDFLIKLFLGQEDVQIKLPLDLCEQGWAKYTEPDFLNSEVKTYSNDKGTLEKEIEKALQKEDYLLADLLKKKLDELLGKK